MRDQRTQTLADTGARAMKIRFGGGSAGRWTGWTGMSGDEAGGARPFLRSSLDAALTILRSSDQWLRRDLME